MEIPSAASLEAETVMLTFARNAVVALDGGRTAAWTLWLKMAHVYFVS